MLRHEGTVQASLAALLPLRSSNEGFRTTSDGTSKGLRIRLVAEASEVRYAPANGEPSPLHQKAFPPAALNGPFTY